MSSREGAVMRMAGGRGEESADSDSVLDCDVGGLSVTGCGIRGIRVERITKYYIFITALFLFTFSSIHCCSKPEIQVISHD